MEAVIAAIKKWYEGETIVHENDPFSPVIVIGWYQKRHWTAKVARVLVVFHHRHWQWIWSTAIAVAAIAVGV